MAIRKVASMGNPVLRKKASPIPVEKIRSEEIQTLLRDMLDTMFEYDGRGLAAPQIHESVQAVVMLWDFDPEEKPSIRYLINPVIKITNKKSSGFWEGCLSVPGLRGWVERPAEIEVEGFDEQAKPFSWKLSGFAATVVQHECDHLEGKLYVDRMKDLTRLAFSQEYVKYWHEAGSPNHD